MTGVHSDSSSISAFSFGAGSGRRTPLPRTSMEVRLDRHFRSRVYTTGETIEGSVRIVAQRQVPFDLLEIVLLGVSRTQVDLVGGAREATHVFLKVAMPMGPSAYPVPRLLEAGQEYVLPFHFVVPAHLTLSACSHRARSDRVRDHHVCLPPAMGDGIWERDDLAPDMARVRYTVRARILREAGHSRHDHPAVIAEAAQVLRILPAGIAPDDDGNADDLLSGGLLGSSSSSRSRDYYALSKSKSLRKGLLPLPLLRTAGSRLGCVRATVTETAAPVVLSADARTASPTAARVGLSFDPVTADVPPPRITAVSAKLVAHTFFSLGPITSLPSPAVWSCSENVSERASCYDSSVPLLERAFGSNEIPWEPQVTTARRDSGYCSEEESLGDDPHSQASASKESVGISYTADLLVPLQLPMDRKTLLPTFHSCIVSRTYSLRLSVSVAPGSTTSSGRYSKSGSRDSGSSSSSSAGSLGGSTTITMAMPLRIVVGSDGAVSGEPDEYGLPSFDAVMEEAEADAHLMPRTIAVPDERFQETSVLPSYSGL